MTKNWSLKWKMLAAFSTVSAFVLVVGGANFFTLRGVVDKFKHVSFINTTKVASLIGMRAAMKETRNFIYQLGIPNCSLEDQQELKNGIADVLKKYEAAEKKFKTNISNDKEKTLFNAQNEKWIPYLNHVNKLVSLALSTNPEDKKEFYTLLDTGYKASTDAYLKEIQLLFEAQNSEADKLAIGADDAAKFGNTLSVILVCIGFVSALIVGWIISGALSRQLGQLASYLRENATSVAGTSGRMADTGNTLSTSTIQQAAALQETVASIEEVSSMVNKNAENAKRSQELSLVSTNVVNKGREVVELMIRAIDDINQSNNDIMQQIQASNQQISDIVKVISEIGNKTKVINDIVFQTKLLSFNASVEAARAGEHGKGFAVVAEEVGNLAQMSGNAAKEISQMLDGSIQKVEGIVNETKTKVERLVILGKEKVSVGTATAKRCGEVLDEIVRNVTEVNHMIGEISNASSEQALGVQEINKAMTQMDQVTQKNSLSSQELTVVADELTGQADSLRGYVHDLLVTVQGHGNGDDASSNQNHNNHDEPSNKSKKNNVVSLKKKTNASDYKRTSASGHSHQEPAVAKPLKKAVGSNIPNHDDPRFEEV